MRPTEHAFRRARRPRTRVRPTCLIQTAPFCDWLKPANQPAAHTATGSAKTPGTMPTRHTHVASQNRRRNPGAPGHPDLAETTPGGANNNQPNYTTDSVLSLLKNGEPLPMPWELGIEMSHIEFVVLNGLGKAYPEAHAWIMRKALERNGDQELLDLIERRNDR